MPGGKPNPVTGWGRSHPTPICIWPIGPALHSRHTDTHTVDAKAGRRSRMGGRRWDEVSNTPELPEQVLKHARAVGGRPNARSGLPPAGGNPAQAGSPPLGGNPARPKTQIERAESCRAAAAGRPPFTAGRRALAAPIRGNPAPASRPPRSVRLIRGTAESGARHSGCRRPSHVSGSPVRARA